MLQFGWIGLIAMPNGKMQRDLSLGVAAGDHRALEQAGITG
jgi:hypothetical protein